MEFNDYQKHSRTTAQYPELDTNIQYPALGLCGEAGEVAEIVKKIMRDKGGQWDGADRQRIAQEIGDVLWYCASLCSVFKLDMSEVAQSNMDKLASRRRRGVIGGNGDNR